MEQLKRITLKTTASDLSQIYGLLVELLVGVTAYDQLLAAYIVKDLTLRVGRGRGMEPWTEPRRKVTLHLSPAEALAVRELILSEDLSPAMTAVARRIMAFIDPLLPSPACFALMAAQGRPGGLPDGLPEVLSDGLPGGLPDGRSPAGTVHRRA